MHTPNPIDTILPLQYDKIRVLTLYLVISNQITIDDACIILAETPESLKEEINIFIQSLQKKAPDLHVVDTTESGSGSVFITLEISSRLKTELTALSIIHKNSVGTELQEGLLAGIEARKQSATANNNIHLLLGNREVDCRELSQEE